LATGQRGKLGFFLYCGTSVAWPQVILFLQMLKISTKFFFLKENFFCEENCGILWNIPYRQIWILEF
jgi:hypothetical protein